MKKCLIFLSLLLSLVLLFCSCSFLFGTGHTEYTVTQNDNVVYYVTDENGAEVPEYEELVTAAYDTALFVKNANGRIAYADSSMVCYTGVDVSFWQNEIDWYAVAADGISFAMLRAAYSGYGDGDIDEDELFRTNMNGATEAGLDVGVYFYSQATTPEEAAKEADYILSITSGYPITYPIVYDWERVDSEGSRTKNMTPEQVTACAVAFCNRITMAGFPVMIYFNKDIGYNYYDLTQLKDYDFWLAEYADTPSFYYHYDIWQYTTDGVVAGIEGNVDLNISFKDFSEVIMG